MLNCTGASSWRGFTGTAHSGHYGADDPRRFEELSAYTTIQQGELPKNVASDCLYNLLRD